MLFFIVDKLSFTQTIINISDIIFVLIVYKIYMFKKNLLPTLVILILLISNIYLSTQFFSLNKQLQEIKSKSTGSVSVRTQTLQVLKEYLNVVLNTKGTVSADDRLKLESDLRQLQDQKITSAWDQFVGSKDSNSSKENAVKLINLLEDKLAE